MSAVLAFDRVAGAHRGEMLFEDVCFALSPGDALMVTRPNGAGKSTLSRIAVGLLPPIDGDVVRIGPTALLAESAALDGDRSVVDALGFWARLDGMIDGVPAALDALALTPLADVPVRMLSTGQRRRVAMARVVASGAPLWLLDEPANGLDAAAIASAGGTRSPRHRANGGVVVVATHLPVAVPGAASLACWETVRMIAIVLRDVRHAYTGGGATLVVAFFLLVAILFPFAIGPDTALLARVGGGVIWAAALLAALIPVERLVAPDLEAGVLDQFRGARRLDGGGGGGEDRRALAGLCAAADAGGGHRGGVAGPAAADAGAGRGGAGDRDAGARRAGGVATACIGGGACAAAARWRGW